MKSRLITVLYPAWTWSIAPHRRFMAASYSADLSTGHNVERQRVVESEWFQSNWPGLVEFTPDQNRKTEFENTRGGKMSITSPGATATGRGVHDVIGDDLVSVDDADSDTKRAEANKFWKTTLRTRL